MYEVGQKVVYIGPVNIYVKQGEVRTIKNTANCCKLLLDVGVGDDNIIATKCNICSKEFQGSTLWTYSDMWVPLDDWQEAEEKVEELLNTELVEV